MHKTIVVVALLGLFSCWGLEAEAGGICAFRGKRYGNGAHWCSGTTLYTCQRGRTRERARCLYGCYSLGSVRAYCKCPGGHTGGQYYCHNGQRYICLRSREAPGGFALRRCATGSACQGGKCAQAPRPCKNNGTTYQNGQTWCSNNTIYECVNKQAQAKARCNHGCYSLSKTQTFCKCPRGFKANQTFCRGDTRMICLGSRKPNAATRVFPCPGGKACRGAGQCLPATTCNFNGQVLQNRKARCARNGNVYLCTNGKLTIAARCKYGCYSIGPDRMYCRCKGPTVAGQHFCQNIARRICKRSIDIAGSSNPKPCPLGQLCQGAGHCRLAPRCTHKGKIYKHGQSWCDGSTILECLKGYVHYKVKCHHGCYNLSPKETFCKCPSSTTKGQYFCQQSIRLVCTASRKPTGSYLASPCPNTHSGSFCLRRPEAGTFCLRRPEAGTFCLRRPGTCSPWTRLGMLRIPLTRPRYAGSRVLDCASHTLAVRPSAVQLWF